MHWLDVAWVSFPLLFYPVVGRDYFVTQRLREGQKKNILPEEALYSYLCKHVGLLSSG